MESIDYVGTQLERGKRAAQKRQAVDDVPDGLVQAFDTSFTGCGNFTMSYNWSNAKHAGKTHYASMQFREKKAKNMQNKYTRRKYPSRVKFSRILLLNLTASDLDTHLRFFELE